MTYKTAFFIIANKNKDPYEDYERYENNAECSICLDNLDSLKKCIKLKVCNHIFHEVCIKEYFLFKRICPLCRKDVDNNDISSCICS